MKAVILAGGTGTRLWPLSRQNKPKQLQSLISERTMLQDTLDRLNFLKPEDIYIATNQEYVEEVKANAPQIPARNIIGEPACRDTAPCIGLAATIISQHSSPDEVMCIVYADHLVQDTAEFVSKIKTAETLALRDNTLNIIEVTAKYPNINLGYVKIGPEIENIDNNPVHSFEKFIEKPNLETAEKFQTEGNYLWNTGFYVWKVSRILQEFATHASATYEHLMKIKTTIGTDEEAATINQQYKECEKISIDYAIMEKVKPEDVRIIPADLGWSDIGTWSAIHDELTNHQSENIVKGDHIGHDTEGSLIYGTSGKPIITIGVRDMIVVETDDSILICPKNRSHDVKKIVEHLREERNHLT